MPPRAERRGGGGGGVGQGRLGRAGAHTRKRFSQFCSLSFLCTAHTPPRARARALRAGPCGGGAIARRARAVHHPLARVEEVVIHVPAPKKERARAQNVTFLLSISGRVGTVRGEEAGRRRGGAGRGGNVGRGREGLGGGPPPRGGGRAAPARPRPCRAAARGGPAAALDAAAREQGQRRARGGRGRGRGHALSVCARGARARARARGLAPPSGPLAPCAASVASHARARFPSDPIRSPSRASAAANPRRPSSPARPVSCRPRRARRVTRPDARAAGWFRGGPVGSDLRPKSLHQALGALRLRARAQRRPHLPRPRRKAQAPQRHRAFWLQCVGTGAVLASLRVARAARGSRLAAGGAVHGPRGSLFGRRPGCGCSRADRTP